MTLSFKRFIPYSSQELNKGIKRVPLNAHWNIMYMKTNEDDDDDVNISVQHKETKCKSPNLMISNSPNRDARNNIIGHLCIHHLGSRMNFIYTYGAFDGNYMRAFCKALRNPRFIMDLFNLKSTKSPFDYCVKKFGPIFDEVVTDGNYLRKIL